MKRHLLMLTLMVSTLYSANQFADEIDIYNISFQPLSKSDSKPIKLNKSKGKWIILSFFENQCRWCLKQMSDFNQLEAKHYPIDIYSVGTGDHAFKLLNWAKKASPHYPLVASNPAIESLTGPLPATPYTFVFTPNGTLHGKLRGYIPLQQWQAWFAKTLN